MTTDGYDNCLDLLRREGLLPHHYRAVYLAGSLIRGWGNAGSDLDVFVICDRHPAAHTDGEVETVALDPPTVPVATRQIDGRRWDVEYWLDDQVAQILDKVQMKTFEADPRTAGLITRKEVDFMERLSYGRPVAGQDWIARRRREIDGSALRSILVSQSMHQADVHIEDAVGQADANDLESAVLSAMMAFNCSVEALVTSHGEFGRGDKWRARRFRLVAQNTMSFAEYWDVQTMRDYDPVDPGRWVTETIRKCQRIALDVVI